MTHIDARTCDQQAIRTVIEARSRALAAKDADAVGDCQGPDFVCFSLAPPLVSTGSLESLDAWFATWDGPLGYELRSLEIIADERVAYAHGLARMSGRKVGGPDVELWFRLTLGLVRTAAGWKIVHEHESTPFYMDGSLRAAVDLKP